MKRKLDLVLLIDDEPADNYLHKRVIDRAAVTDELVIFESAGDALEYLDSPGPDGQRPQPDLIFLDINMPAINGWEFLEEIERRGLGKQLGAVIFMVSTSMNPADFKRAEEMPLVSGYVSKHLSAEALAGILNDHLP